MVASGEDGSEKLGLVEVRRNMKLFVYAKANTMDGYLQNGDCHRFTDDVALCYANSLEEAMDIFVALSIAASVVPLTTPVIPIYPV